MFSQSFLYFSLFVVSIINRFCSINQFLAQARGLIYQSFLWSFKNKLAQLIFSMLFGAVEDFNFALKNQFQMIGFLHVISASGFNVALITQVFQQFTRVFLPKRIRDLVQVWLIVCYCMLAQNSASIWRAGLMLIWSVIINGLWGLKSRAELNLILAAIFLLIIKPSLLESLSFQLSVLATAGLIWLAPCFTQSSPWLSWQTLQIDRLNLQRKNGDSSNFSIKSASRTMLVKMLKEMKNSLVICLIAQAAIMPLIANTFNEFSLLSLVATPLLLWLTPLITVGGLYWALLAQIAKIIQIPQVAVILAWPLQWLTEVFLWGVAVLSKYQALVLTLPSWSRWLSCIWWVGLLAYGFCWRKIRTYQAKKVVSKSWNQLFI